MSAWRCRATLLLQKELFKIKQNDIWGISVEDNEEDENGDPIDETNLFLWRVTLSGLISTPWQDAKLKLKLVFDKNFNVSPPQIFFVGTLPFHPNVSTTDGRVCMGCLEEAWGQSCSVASILVTLQQLLSEPYFSQEAWNKTALQVALDTPKQYDQIVEDIVEKSQSINEDDTSSDHEQPGASNVRTKNKYFTINTTLQQQSDHHYTDIKLPDMQQSNTTVLSSNHPHHDLPTRIRKSSEKLSFENYLQGWKSLGTTNEASNCADSTSITIFEGCLDFSEPSIKDTVSDEIYQQLSDHRKLTYGSFKNNADEEMSRKRAELLRANKVQLIKDIHSNKKTLKSLRLSLPASPVNSPNNNDLFDDDQASQIEAQELVKWSQKLP